MTSTWLQARIAEKPELADQLNADNVGRKQRLQKNYMRWQLVQARKVEPADEQEKDDGETVVAEGP